MNTPLVALACLAALLPLHTGAAAYEGPTYVGIGLAHYTDTGGYDCSFLGSTLTLHEESEGAWRFVMKTGAGLPSEMPTCPLVIGAESNVVPILDAQFTLSGSPAAGFSGSGSDRCGTLTVTIEPLDAFTYFRMTYVGFPECLPGGYAYEGYVAF